VSRDELDRFLGSAQTVRLPGQGEGSHDRRRL
jgi:hypothetical protein